MTPVPGLERLGLLHAQNRHAVVVLNLLEQDVDLVSRLDLVPVLELLFGYEALGLVADLDEDAIVALLGDAPR